MASGSIVPHSFPGLLEDTWPGMPQWSKLVLHHTCTCRRQQSRLVLQLSRLLFAKLPNMHCCLQPMCLYTFTSHFIFLRISTRKKFPPAAPFHLCAAPQCHCIQGYISGWS